LEKYGAVILLEKIDWKLTKGGRGFESPAP